VRGSVWSFLITLAVVLALAAATFSIITFLTRVNLIFLFIGVGLGGGAIGLVVRFHQYIAALCGEPLPVRSDLQFFGTDLYHLSKQVILDRRIEDELGTSLERAASITLTALDRLPTLAETQPKFAREIELGLHEAMHEVLAVVHPFVRPKGIGKTRHAKTIGHLDPSKAREAVGVLIAKLDAVNENLSDPEPRELQLDQTLARLQELKRAEAELDQTLIH
jgi:hypothetical protein